MPLKSIKMEDLKVQDISVFADMPLESVSLQLTKVTDISVLQGKKLRYVNLDRCNISDLSPLEGAPLLTFHPPPNSRLNVASHQFLLARKLQLGPLADRINEIYRAPPELAPAPALGLRDARALQDLSFLLPLKLRSLDISYSGVSNLSPLAGGPIEFLACSNSSVSNLSPLKDLQLRFLNLNDCKQLSDLSPLRGLPLKWLAVSRGVVSDLRPLVGLPLTHLSIADNRVTDLTPLLGLKLEVLIFSPGNIKEGLDIVRIMKSLRLIGTDPYRIEKARAADEFWRRLDGE
jgi:Leucine-rich repeat (LRR) protein